MSKYGDAAVLATKLYHDGRASTPNYAWAMAVSTVFPGKKSLQKKSCPRGAYLGLCESGAILGVTMGNYCRSVRNKEYAIIALSLLKENPSLSRSEKTLWCLVVGGHEKKPNHQMDVVISLWNAGLINS